MAVNSSGKPAAQSVSSADPTKDIDDDWADDDETGGVPSVTATVPPTPESAQASGEEEPASGPKDIQAGSTEPGAKRSVSGTLPTLQHDSEAPATDEIDSDWPDEPEDAKVPEIPKQARVPNIDGAPSVAPAMASSSSAAPSTQAPSTIPPTSANFEKAAQRLAEESDLSAGWGDHQHSEPPAASEAAPSGEKEGNARPQEAREDRPRAERNVDSERTPESSSEAKTRSTSEKKRSPLAALAVAAAAVALVGLALKTTAPTTQPSAEPVVQKATPPKPVAEPEQKPTAQPTPDAEKAAAEVDDANGDSKGGDAKAGEGDTDNAPPSAQPGEKVLVHLAITPDGAEIYHKGQRLGKSQIRVEVDPSDKMVLLVVKEGYYPRKVILDGAEQYVNVGMRERPLQAEPARQPAPVRPNTPTLAAKKPAPKPPSPGRPPVPRGTHGSSTQAVVPPGGR